MSITYVNGDVTPPAISASSFEYQTAPRQLKFTFTEDVSDTLAPDDVVIKNLSTNTQFNPTTLAYNFQTNTATFDLPPNLPDANYTATVLHSGVKDLAGNTVSADYAQNFFILTGDLNGDRRVSIADFITLAANFGKSPATWSDGDLNYDNAVTISDFIDLSSHFGQTLPEPPSNPQPAFSSNILVSKASVLHHHKHRRRLALTNRKSDIANL